MEIGKKLKEKGGASVIVFIGILFALIALSLVFLEYFRVTGLYESITEELERSGNIAVEYAMIDDARGYHISTIDIGEAEKQFDAYFRDRLKLTDDYRKYDEQGALLYWIVFDNLVFDDDTPQIIMEGTICVNLQLVGSYATAPVELPFTVTTRNVNAAD